MTFKSSCNTDQQFIPNRMTKTIVDVLESIEIQEKDGEKIWILSLRARYSELEVLFEECAVWKSSNSVMKGVMD